MIDSRNTVRDSLAGVRVRLRASFFRSSSSFRQCLLWLACAAGVLVGMSVVVSSSSSGNRRRVLSGGDRRVGQRQQQRSRLPHMRPGVGYIEATGGQESEFQKQQKDFKANAQQYTASLPMIQRSLPSVVRKTMKAHQGPVYTIKFDASGEYIMSAGEDRYIYLWNVQDGSLVKKFPIMHNAEIVDLLVSEDRTTFISAGADGQVLMWDTLRGVVKRRFRGAKGKINCIAWNKDQSILACGGEDGNVYVWDIQAPTNFPIQIFSEAHEAVSAIFIDQPILASSSLDGRLRVYDVRTGKILVRGFDSALSSACISKDRRMFVVGSLDDTLRLLDRETGDELMVYRGHSNRAYRLKSQLAWDNSILMSPSEDGKICFWNVVTGQLKHSVSHGDSVVLCAEPHPKFNTMVTAGADGIIKYWVAQKFRR